MNIVYVILRAHDGAYLRFSRGVPGAGPPGAKDIHVESASSYDAGANWVVRARVPPASVGWVAHHMALLGLCGALYGQHGSYVKGSEEDVKRLAGLLALL